MKLLAIKREAVLDAEKMAIRVDRIEGVAISRHKNNVDWFVDIVIIGSGVAIHELYKDYSAAKERYTDICRMLHLLEERHVG